MINQAVLRGRQVLLALAMLLPRCGGCGPDVELVQDYPLLFVEPLSGARISRDDDVNKALDGIQINVRLSTVAPADAVVTLVVGDVELNAAAGSGDVSFASITVPLGMQTLTARAGQTEVSIAINVVDQGSPCEFVEPRDGDELAATDDVDVAREGFQSDITVSCAGLAAGTKIALGIKDRRKTVLTIDGIGRAVLKGFDLAEGPNVLEIDNENGLELTTATITVNTGACLVEILPGDDSPFVFDSLLDPPGGTLTPTRTLAVKTSCANAAITLTIVGSVFDASECTKPVSATYQSEDVGELRAFAGVTLYQGDVVASATVIDGDKTGRALANNFHVDTYGPRLVSLSPDDGSVVDVVDDDPALPGFQITVRGQAIGLEAGATQLLRVTDSMSVMTEYETIATNDSDCFDQTTDVGRFEWPRVALSDGIATLELTIADALGNTTTQTIQIDVNTLAPTLTITKPTGLPALLTLQDDADPAAGMQLGFELSLSGVPSPSGLAGALVLPGQTPQFFVFSVNPQPLQLSLADGQIQDAYATVTLADGRVVESQRITFEIDGTPPFVAELSPREGDVVQLASINVTVALQTETQDRQIRLLVAGSVLQTETVAAAPKGGEPLTFTFAMPLALASGVNDLTVEVDDRLGMKKNTSTLPLSVFRVTSAPTITFTALSGVSGALSTVPTLMQLGPSDRDATVTNGFDVRAAAHLNAAPGETLIELSVTDTSASAPTGPWLTLVRTVEDTGTLDVSDIDFSLWANEDVSLWLTMTEAFTGAVASTRVNVRVELPVLNDAMVKVVSPLTDSRTNSLAYAVQIETDPLLNAASKSCTLSLDGVDADAGTFSSATFTFVGTHTSLTDGAHSYHVRCTSGAQLFYSQRVGFTYRSSAPSIAFGDGQGVQLTAPSGAHFNALALDSSLAAGYQHDIDVVAGEPDGAVVTLRVDGSIVATEPLLAGVAHFRDVTLASAERPSGVTIALAAFVDDAFGFGTLTVSRTVLLDLEPPTVVLGGGACPQSINVNNPFDQPSFDAIEWRADFATTGLANGATVTTKVLQPSGESNVFSTVASDGSTAALAFSVPTPPSPFSVGFFATVVDAAGNTAASATCSTTVNPALPSVSFRANAAIGFVDVPTSQTLATTQIGLDDDQNSAVSGVQLSVTVTIQNMAGGATVNLCSTASDPILNSAPACTKVPGKVLATGVSTQSAGSISQVLFTNVSLIDALITPFGLAVEAIEPMSGQTITTPAQPMGFVTRSFPVLVDSRDVPTFVSLSSTRNIPANDRTNVLVLGKRVWRTASSVYDDEGNTGVTGQLDPGTLVFTMSGATNILATATLQSNRQALSASASFSGNNISFTSVGGLIEGLHTLTLTAATSSGNSRTVTASVLVDVTLPTVVVAQASDDPFTCPSGECTSGGLLTSVQMDVVDNNDLLGGCGCVRLLGDPQCLNTTSLCGSNPVFSAGSSAAVAQSAMLSEGANAVVAEAVDAAGNVGVSSSKTYNVDSLAVSSLPQFELSPTAGSCASFAARCSLAPYDQGAAACRDNFPAAGTDPGNASEPTCARWYKSGVYRVGTLGTTTTACPLGGDCSHSIRLLGTPLDSLGTAIGAPVTVFLSDKVVTGDIAIGTLLETIAPAVAAGLDRANNWSLVLEAQDPYGNFSRSPARFATLPNFGGALVSVAHVTGGTGAVTSNSYFGVRHNKNTTAAPFVSDVSVNLTWTATPPPTAPRCVELSVDGGVPLAGVSTANLAGPEVIAFPNVTLPVGGPFTLQAQVRDGACGAGVIAAVSLSGIRSTITAPSVSFQCAWRQALGFGSDCAAAPSLVIAASASGPSGALVDRYPGTSGFQFLSPPIVDVSGADGGTVALSSNIATLTGTISRPVGVSGPVSFDDTLTIPTVMTPGTPATTSTHVISARACNVAGDCVTATHTLPIKANADPPAQVGTTLVCTGQTSGAFADAPGCASLCTGVLCDRRAGKAVIAFTAPAANAGTVASVAGYDVAVAIADTAVVDEASCNSLVLSGTTRTSDLLVPATVQGGLATPGNQQVLAITKLPIHQRLCVAARAKDDVGNASAPRSTVRTSLLDPVTLATQTFTRTSGDSERPLEDNVPMASLPIQNPRGAVTIGDMDGDGGVEFAVAGSVTGPSGDVETVFVFSSKRTRDGTLAPSVRFSPREVIQAPPSGAPGFGVGSLAGGDFNGDGFADLAIGDAGADLPSGFGGGGAVYVYYGAGNAAAMGDTTVIADASCPMGVGNVPARNGSSVLCPQAILTLPPGHFLGWALAAGHITTAVAPSDPRKPLLTYPTDLLVGDASQAVYLARRSLFTDTASTLVFDLGAVNANVTAITSNDGNDFIGTSMAAVDLDGDQRMDIAIGNDGSFFGSYHSIYFFDAAVLPASPTNLNAPRCDTMSSVTLRALNMSNVGRLSGTGSDWLLAHVRDDLLQAFEGSATFFAVTPGCTDVALRTDAPSLSAAQSGPLAPIRRFGASLDDACNATPATRVGAVNIFDTFFGASGIGDFDGDGDDDFMVGQPGALGESSRTLVVSYAPHLCGTGNHFRVIAELTGNTSSSGLGSFVFNAGLHAGGSYPSLGIVGRDLSAPPQTLVNLYR